MAEVPSQPSYFVVTCTLAYGSFEEAKAAAAEDIAAHIARSKHLHAAGTLLMAGAFLDQPGEPLRTMAVLTSREAADDYIKGDPFYRKGLMREWAIRGWHNMFA